MTMTEYPRLLQEHVRSVQESCPAPPSVPSSVCQVFDEQERISTAMAEHLESLAAHYDQMASALREGETGVEFSEQELLGK